MTKYRLTSTPEGSYEVHLTGAPENCFALAMAPNRMEDNLRSGRWLVMLAAVWSVPDVKLVDRAVRVAVGVPQVRVGIRPFEHHIESAAWLPDLNIDAVSPIWAVLDNGRLVATLIGAVSEDELIAAVTSGSPSADHAQRHIWPTLTRKH